MIEFVQMIYQSIGVSAIATQTDVVGLFTVIAILLGSATNVIFKRGKKTPEIEAPKTEVAKNIEEVAIVPEVKKPAPVEKSWSERLNIGLKRSSNELFGKLGNLLGKGKVDQDVIDEIEELLYGADLGPKIVSELLEEIESENKKGELNVDTFKTLLFRNLHSKISPVQSKVSEDLFFFDKNKTDKKLKVIMIVGVNGAGKTTTIGKLATKLTRQGAKVVVGACDTFRAAAVDQLQVWCDRAGAEMIRAKEGANPSGVGYDALQMAINSGADYCLLDTAGRLHTKENLMDELRKSKAVLAKLDPTAPHETLLVIDAITGQNALRQAEEFNQTLNLTGLIFTKCDGSSKAGSAVGIVEKLQVPITYIGVGETVEDLNVFELNDYLKALLSQETLGKTEEVALSHN
jgi:fused signal recognition particle receptor